MISASNHRSWRVIEGAYGGNVAANSEKGVHSVKKRADRLKKKRTKEIEGGGQNQFRGLFDQKQRRLGKKSFAFFSISLSRSVALFPP